MERQVKCSKCDHVGPQSTFPTGTDFFQNKYISKCPKECGNRQSPGDASMRGFGGERPFVFVESRLTDGTIVDEVQKRMAEAS